MSRGPTIDNAHGKAAARDRCSLHLRDSDLYWPSLARILLVRGTELLFAEARPFWHSPGWHGIDERHAPRTAAGKGYLLTTLDLESRALIVLEVARRIGDRQNRVAPYNLPWPDDARDLLAASPLEISLRPEPESDEALSFYSELREEMSIEFGALLYLPDRQEIRHPDGRSWRLSDANS